MMFKRGYTLVELMVAVGLFAVVMMLASGSYVMMISFSRQAQGVATGIDNLSFALETMMRGIRTGNSYSCGGTLGMGDCGGTGYTIFSYRDEGGSMVTYSLESSAIQRKKEGESAKSVLTDSSSVTIDSLLFYVVGSASNDKEQARVTVIIKGTVSPNKDPQNFTIQTGATMRGSDI